MGSARNGAHFPLAVFTHNACKRSPLRYVQRREKEEKMKGKGRGKRGEKGGTKGTVIAGKGGCATDEAAVAAGPWRTSATNDWDHRGSSWGNSASSHGWGDAAWHWHSRGAE